MQIISSTRGTHPRSVRLACANCGKQFWRCVAAAAVAKHRHYCSRDCKHVGEVGKHLNPTFKACGVCGKEFRALYVGHRFCSRACTSLYFKGNPQFTGRPRAEPTIIACAHCGEGFPRKRARSKFCSPKCRQQSARVYADKAEQRTAADRRRRLREMGASGWHTEAEWQALCLRARGKCTACGRKAKLTRDHIIPLAAGGSDDITNIQPLCTPCNSRKGARRTHLL
jgi:5-methylcytosine-specific restriction endonuclease McrA